MEPLLNSCLFRHTSLVKLLMISGDRSILQGKRGAFWYTLEELRKHWDRIDVICPRGEIRNQEPRPTGSSGRAETNEVIQPFENVFFHPSPKSLWYQPRWIFTKGRELIAREHHSVMTVHEYPPFYNGIGAWFLARATKIPYVLEVHHIVGYPVAADLQEGIGRILSRVYLPLAARPATAIRTVNALVKETLHDWNAPVEKIFVVPSFYLDRHMLETHQSVPKKFDLVACGRLVPNKGFKALIESLLLLPEATLLIIGDGPERAHLVARTQVLGLSGRVTFAGWLPTQEDVIGALRSASVFVLPSLSEGGPRVALEAMALGLPVLVTRVGVLPEVIHEGENGLFTDGTAGDIAFRAKRLLEDPSLRHRLGERAKNVLDQFDREVLIKSYAVFLQSLA